MGHSSIFRSHPHKYGPGSRICRVCSNGHGIIRKVIVKLHICNNVNKNMFLYLSLVWLDDLSSMLPTIFKRYWFQEARLDVIMKSNRRIKKM